MVISQRIDGEWYRVVDGNWFKVIGKLNKFEDAWEYSDGVIECDSCGKKFNFRSETSVEYITEADCYLNGKEHEWIIGKTIRGSVRECNNCNKYEVR